MVFFQKWGNDDVIFCPFFLQEVKIQGKLGFNVGTLILSEVSNFDQKKNAENNTKTMLRYFSTFQKQKETLQKFNY